MNNKVEKPKLHLQNVSDSTSNKYGVIVTLAKEIDDICQYCKYGKNNRTDEACYSCGDTIKLNQYYR